MIIHKLKPVHEAAASDVTKSWFANHHRHIIAVRPADERASESHKSQSISQLIEQIYVGWTHILMPVAVHGRNIRWSYQIKSPVTVQHIAVRPADEQWVQRPVESVAIKSASAEHRPVNFWKVTVYCQRIIEAHDLKSINNSMFDFFRTMQENWLRFRPEMVSTTNLID